MDLPILLVFIIIGITIVLFATEFFAIDKIAFLVIIAVVLLGLATPEEAISGFSNPAVITILALMIIAVGLETNGVIQWLTLGIKQLKFLPFLLMLPIFMLVSASISSFISTTAVVIIFIKIISKLEENHKFSASKLLMPISFAGILGGSCTLMGTSTNLIVNSIASKSDASFSFFEFSFYGIIFLSIGVIFMTVASRFLPKDKREDVRSEFDIDNYIFTVKILEKSDLVGKTLSEIDFVAEDLVTPLKLIRSGNVTNAPGPYVELKVGDNLVLMSTFEDFNSIMKEHDLLINDERRKAQNQEFAEGGTDEPSDMTYVELLILPGSNLIGYTLDHVRQLSLNGAYPIAIKKRKNLRNTKERLIRKDFRDINMKPGDRLLVELQEQNLGNLYAIDNVAVLNQYEKEPVVPLKRKITASVILLLVISLAATSVLSILEASLTGVAAMLLLKLITLEKIYQQINWQIIFLLAGMIPLGIAMSNTGADKWISTQLFQLLEGQTPLLVIGILFGMTILLSGFISNNATAIIMTPIAIAMAAGFSLDVKPFILAVMFGANFSFFTPIGYQTNTLIYGTGRYQFKHFLVVGGLLTLILWVVGTFMLTQMLS